jgi:hypothetical protein
MRSTGIATKSTKIFRRSKSRASKNGYRARKRSGAAPSAAAESYSIGTAAPDVDTKQDRFVVRYRMETMIQ